MTCSGDGFYTPSAQYNYQALSVRKMGRLVQLNGLLNARDTAQANSTTGTIIPSGYRPPVRVPVWEGKHSVSSGGESAVNTNGTITIGPYHQGKTFFVFNATWLV